RTGAGRGCRRNRRIRRRRRGCGGLRCYSWCWLRSRGRAGRRIWRGGRRAMSAFLFAVLFLADLYLAKLRFLSGRKPFFGGSRELRSSADHAFLGEDRNGVG